MSRRGGSGFVLVSVASAVLLLATACSGGTEPSGAGRGDDRPPDEAPQTTTTAPLATAGVIEADGLDRAGDHGVLDSLHTVGSVTYGAGSVQDLTDGSREPLVVRRGGGGWERVPLDADGGAAVASAVVTIDDEAVAYGSGETGADDDVVAWPLDGTGERLELTGAVVGAGAQTVTTAASGPAGVLLAGHLDGVPTLWWSADGRVWTEVDLDPLLEPDENLDHILDVAVDARAAVALVSTGARHLVLASAGSSDFEVLEAAPHERRTFQAVVAVPGGFLVGGGDSGGDDRAEPSVWRTDGTRWPDGGETLPVTDEAGTSNRGYAVVDLDVNAERVVASYGYAAATSAPTGGAWTVLSRDGLPDGTEPTEIAAGTGAVVAETLDDARTIYSSDGLSWADTTNGSVPVAAEVLEPDDVAHREGTWVLAGAATTPDGTPTATAWWSDDGRRWTQAEPLPGGRGFHTTAVGTSSTGFVLAGQSDSGGDAAVWTSPDGRTWSVVEAPLLFSEPGGVRQIESIVPRPDGALLAGYDFDGSVIQPFVLQLLPSEGLLQQAEVPPMTRAQSVTVGLCTHDETYVVVGGGMDDRAHPGWWVEGATGWEPHETDFVGTIEECASLAGRLLALGSGEDGGHVLELAEGSSPSLLPGGSSLAVDHLLGVGERAVVVGHGTDAAADALLWISDAGVDDEPDEWEIVQLPELGGPGAQYPAGVATDGDTVLLALHDGGAVRLVSIALGR